MAKSGLTITLPARTCKHKSCEKEHRSYCKIDYNRLRYAALRALGFSCHEAGSRRVEGFKRQRENLAKARRKYKEKLLRKFGGRPDNNLVVRVKWLEHREALRHNKEQVI